MAQSTSTSVVEHPSWLCSREELINSPSRIDGVSREEECLFLRQTCDELTSLGMRIYSKREIGTAMILFHRFFTRRSILKHERWLIACACLIVAWKATDFSIPAKFSQIVPIYLSHLTGNTERIDQNSEAYVNTKERLVQAERLLLYVLEYDVDIDLPFHHIEDLLRDLGIGKPPGPPPQPPGFHDDPRFNFYEGSFKSVNEAMRTTLCVQYDARTLAMGCLCYVRDQLMRHGFLTPSNWDAVISAHITSEAAADIGNQIRETLAMAKRATQQGSAAGSGVPSAAGAGAGTAASDGDAMVTDASNPSVRGTAADAPPSHPPPHPNG